MSYWLEKCKNFIKGISRALSLTFIVRYVSQMKKTLIGSLCRPSVRLYAAFNTSFPPGMGKAIICT